MALPFADFVLSLHFIQYIKGSEVERRRATLLRRKANEEDDWVYVRSLQFL